MKGMNSAMDDLIFNERQRREMVPKAEGIVARIEGGETGAAVLEEVAVLLRDILRAGRLPSYPSPSDTENP